MRYCYTVMAKPSKKTNISIKTIFKFRSTTFWSIYKYNSRILPAHICFIFLVVHFYCHQTKINYFLKYINSYFSIQAATVTFADKAPIKSYGISSVFLNRIQDLPISSLDLQTFSYSVTNH